MRAMFLSTALIAFTAISMVVNGDRARDLVEVRTTVFGGDGFEQCYSAQVTSDGGCVLGGWTDSFGSGLEDMVIVKIDPDGHLEWEKTFGGNADDYCECVQQTTDGGYILAGWTSSFGAGGYDMLLVKTGSRGNLEWQRTFGGSGDDYCYSAQQTGDGGYLLGGASRHSFYASTDMYAVKTDSRGDLEWERTYGGDENDGCYSVRQTADGGYILAGDSKSFSEGPCDYDMYLVKTDSQGDLIWQETFGNNQNEYAYASQQPQKEAYILAGYSESSSPNGDDIRLTYITDLDKVNLISKMVLMK